MVGDTSNFRNPHYHQPTDTLDTLDLGFATDVTRATLALAAARSGLLASSIPALPSWGTLLLVLLVGGVLGVAARRPAPAGEPRTARRYFIPRGPSS